VPDAPKRPRSTLDPKGEFPLDLTTYIFHLFAVVGRHREVRLESVLKPIGLNLARHRALSVVSTLEPCTMSELADFSAVDRTTLTRTVDQLVEAGLVERVTPREDRRQVLISTTEAGRAVYRKALQAIFRLNRNLLSGLTEAQQRHFARALEAFLDSLIDDPALEARLLLRDGRALR